MMISELCAHSEVLHHAYGRGVYIHRLVNKMSTWVGLSGQEQIIFFMQR